jgi:hypothetical protein
MRRFLPTILLVVICVAGFWYAKSQSFFKTDDSKAEQKLVLVEVAEVKGFSINLLGETVQLDKNDGIWAMSKPAAYPIDKYSPDDWVGTFVDLVYTSKIDDQPDDLASFGLDKPSQQYQITLKDGSVKKLLIGKSLPVPGNSYAKLDDAPAVYEVSDQTLQGLQRTPIDFLDTATFAFQYEKIKSLSVEWKGDKWLLEKMEANKTVYDTKWKIGSLELKPGDGMALLDKLTNMTTEELVKPASDVKVDAPELKAEIKQVDNGKELATSYVGKVDKDDIWIVKQGGAWAYKLPVVLVQDLYENGKNPAKQ